jgi:sirohydrochlorin cobaltochelatase
MTPKPHSALVILGHGSTVNPDSSAPTLAHAAEIRRRGLFAEVVCGFWKEKPALREVLSLVGSREVYVVPNFISEGYFTREVIPREMGLPGAVTHRDGRVIKYCEPSGSHPRMTDLLLHRAAGIAPGIPREQTSLVIVGHGTTRNENSAAAVNGQVEKIAAMNIYGEVAAAFMEQEPFVADWRTLTTRPNVVVVPFFISDGLHSYQDIPVLIGIDAEPAEAASRREVFRHNPHHLHGRELYYSGAIGTDPEFAEVILEQVAAFDAGRE